MRVISAGEKWEESADDERMSVEDDGQVFQLRNNHFILYTFLLDTAVEQQ